MVLKRLEEQWDKFMSKKYPKIKQKMSEKYKKSVPIFWTLWYIDADGEQKKAFCRSLRADYFGHHKCRNSSIGRAIDL